MSYARKNCVVLGTDISLSDRIVPNGNPVRCVWEGDENTLWSNSGNWSTNSVPDGNDQAVFLNGSNTTVTGASGTVGFVEIAANWGGEIDFSGNAIWNAVGIESGRIDTGSHLLTIKDGDFYCANTEQIEFAGLFNITPSNGEIRFWGYNGAEYVLDSATMVFDGDNNGANNGVMVWTNAKFTSYGSGDEFNFIDNITVNMYGTCSINLDEVTDITTGATVTIGYGAAASLTSGNAIRVLSAGDINVSANSTLTINGTATIDSVSGLSLYVKDVGSLISTYGGSAIKAEGAILFNTTHDTTTFGGMIVYGDTTIWGDYFSFATSQLKFQASGAGDVTVLGDGGSADGHFVMTDSKLRVEANHGGTSDRVTVDKATLGSNNSVHTTFNGAYTASGTWCFLDTDNDLNGTFTNYTSSGNGSGVAFYAYSNGDYFVQVPTP